MPENQEVVLEISGKRYTLALNNDASDRFDSVSELGVWGFADLLRRGRSPKHSDVVKLFWACAEARNPAWSLETARSLCPPAKSPDVMAALIRMLARDLQDPEAKPEEGAKKNGAPLEDSASVSAT